MEQRFELQSRTDPEPEELQQDIEQACNLMEDIYAAGEYPKVLVKRSWSKHNPIITGEIARPKAYRWYLLRELYKLAENELGASTKETGLHMHIRIRGEGSSPPACQNL